MVVAGQFGCDEAIGGGLRGVAEMAQLYGDAPIIRERLVEVVRPDGGILRWVVRSVPVREV